MKKRLLFILLVLPCMAMLHAQQSPSLKIGLGPSFTGTGDSWGPTLRADYEQPIGNRFFTSFGVRGFSSSNIQSSKRYRMYQSIAADLNLGVKIAKTSRVGFQVFGGVSFANAWSIYYAGFYTDFDQQGNPIEIPYSPNRESEFGIGWTAGLEANVLFDKILLGIRPTLQLYTNGDNLLGLSLIFGLVK